MPSVDGTWIRTIGDFELDSTASIIGTSNSTIERKTCILSIARQIECQVVALASTVALSHFMVFGSEQVCGVKKNGIPWTRLYGRKGGYGLSM